MSKHTDARDALTQEMRAFCAAETQDDRSEIRRGDVGFLRQALHRAQEIIKGLAAGAGELRKENQAYWNRISQLEKELKEARKVVPLVLPSQRLREEQAPERVGDVLYKRLLSDYREVVRQRDTLQQERDDLLRVVNMRRGFSTQYLAMVDLEHRISRAEFVYAVGQGAKSWVRRDGMVGKRGPYARLTDS